MSEFSDGVVVAAAAVDSTVEEAIANQESPVGEACNTHAAVTIDVPVVEHSTVTEWAPRTPGIALLVAVVAAVASCITAALIISWLMVAPLEE